MATATDNIKKSGKTLLKIAEYSISPRFRDFFFARFGRGGIYAAPRIRLDVYRFSGNRQHYYSPSINLHHPSSSLRTPILAAIDRADPQIVSILLEKNLTPLDDTLTYPCGRTALMYASFVSTSTEVLSLLLKKGADATKTDIRGWSCLYYAVVGKRLKNVTFLLDYGVSVCQRDFRGRSALMISVYLSNLDILSILLEYGSDINALDKAGLTALQLAIMWRKRDAAIMLIERGSDTSVVTPVRKVPIGQLCRTSMPNILRCIEEKNKDL